MKIASLVSKGCLWFLGWESSAKMTFYERKNSVTYFPNNNLLELFLLFLYSTADDRISFLLDDTEQSYPLNYIVFKKKGIEISNYSDYHSYHLDFNYKRREMMVVCIDNITQLLAKAENSDVLDNMLQRLRNYGKNNPKEISGELINFLSRIIMASNVVYFLWCLW